MTMVSGNPYRPPAVRWGPPARARLEGADRVVVVLMRSEAAPAPGVWWRIIVRESRIVWVVGNGQAVDPVFVPGLVRDLALTRAAEAIARAGLAGSPM